MYMKMNAFVSEKIVNGMEASIYSISGLEDRFSENERYREAWRLSRSFSGATVPYLGGEKILLLEEGEPQVKCGDLVATLEKSVTVDLGDPTIKSAIENLFNQELKARMAKLGYITERGNVIPREFKRYRLDNGEPIHIHENGAQVHVEGLPNGHLIVWIDPKVRVKQQALEYIHWRRNHNSEEEIDRGSAFSLQPKNHATIVCVVLCIWIGDGTVAGTPMSLPYVFVSESQTRFPHRLSVPIHPWIEWR